MPMEENTNRIAKSGARGLFGSGEMVQRANENRRSSAVTKMTTPYPLRWPYSQE
jgi:hypothetical protein